ncbi:ABC transporter G family member 36 [Vitis vinifera]|uniref:ABC transporter G family member 36 n=1 Tax=Vitis vinifera TaxID=29760 RepID=A0A438KE65_VITVI|nr:ABC transporter G family member 36 [Vitis vinifera]
MHGAVSYPDPSRKGKRRFSFSYPRKSKRRWQSVDIRIVSTTHPDNQHEPSGYKSSGWSIKVKRVLHAITTSSHGPHLTCRMRRQEEVTASHFPRSFYIHFPRSLTAASPTMVSDSHSTPEAVYICLRTKKKGSPGNLLIPSKRPTDLYSLLPWLTKPSEGASGHPVRMPFAGTTLNQEPLCVENRVSIHLAATWTTGYARRQQFALLLVVVLGGFVLSKDDVKPWWEWGYWVSPLMYGQNAISVNEFLGNSWRHVPANSTESLGVLVLKARGAFTEPHWYWLGVGALIGYVLLFNFLFTLALSYLNQTGARIQSGSSRSLSARVGSITEADQRRKRGMVLPFEPLSISFDEIRYAVDMPQEMKAQGVTEDRLELLKGVSGSFRPGILTALMGVTGAGKTTLMDVLAGRKTSGYIEGIIKVSGYPKKQETFARVLGYCEQTDIHSPHVTVYESLIYSAWLRLPSEVDSATRKMFIEEVMELVELNSLREALVGLPSENGLSTEQRKRLTIAVELVANPSIIFMDEPTSGLDARAAAIVMRTVRNTVDTGRTVVCTIHQPSIDIFDAFDELLLLKRGGEEIYTGPIGHHSSHLIKYFEGINGISKIKDGYNPSTWMLELTSAAQEAALGEKQGIDQGTEFTPSRVKRPLLLNSIFTIFLHTMFGLPMETALVILEKPSIHCREIVLHNLHSFNVWDNILDSGSKRKRQQDLFNAMGCMYVSVIFIGIQNAFSVQAVVAIERTVFYRERAAGMYSAFPYAFGQVMIELPHIFIQTIIFGLIVYAMVGFEWTVTKFFWYLFFMYFTFLYFTFYGMMAVAITPNQHISGIVSSAFYGLWNLFSGFIIPHTRIPVWWKWYFWSCPVSWTLYGLVVTQFGDIKERLESGERVEDFVRMLLWV